MSDYSLINLMIEKKELILQTAMRLFSEKGYDSTPTSRIAKEAGVSEGLIFRHFETKEGLLHAIMAQGMAQIAESMTGYGGSGNAVEQHVDSAFSILKANKVFWRLVQQMRFQESVQRTGQDTIQQVNQMVISTLAAYFQQQQAAHPQAEALLLFALIDGVCIHYLQQPDDYPLDAIASLIKSKYI